MNRDQTLDSVKCLMNYMVVLLHAYAAFQYVACNTVEFYIWKIICSYMCWMAIPCFFLISGYYLFKGYTLASFPQKMNRRVKRLFVPYVAWNTIFVVIYLMAGYVVPRLAKRVETFGLDTVSGAISKILSLTVPPIDGPLWFIRSLLILSVLSPIVWLSVRCKGRIFVLLMSLLMLGCNFLGLTDKDEFLLPSYSIICFSIGGWMAVHGRDILLTFKNVNWFVAGMVGCVVIAVLDSIKFKGADLIISACAILEAPAMISIIPRLHMESFLQTRWFVRLKEMSFFAYAGHFLFCSIWLHSTAPLLKCVGSGKFTLLIMIFCVCGVSTMAIVYATLKKICPKWLKIFDGTL